MHNETKCNPELGRQVQKHLISLGLEVAARLNVDGAHICMRDGVGGFLEHMGLLPDPSRDDTPRRVADMFVNDLCWGLNYTKFPKCTTTPNGHIQDSKPNQYGMTTKKSVGAYDQMVRVAKIQTTSLCEHHLQCIYGWTHIAYIPGREVLGLSKFARVTEFFARRPQIQERMSEQLHAALCFILKTDDVAVVQDCQHFCMIARGAIQHEARTQTDKMSGRFLSNASLRAEFLHGLPRS